MTNQEAIDALTGIMDAAKNLDTHMRHLVHTSETRVSIRDWKYGKVDAHLDLINTSAWLIICALKDNGEGQGDEGSR